MPLKNPRLVFCANIGNDIELPISSRAGANRRVKTDQGKATRRLDFVVHKLEPILKFADIIQGDLYELSRDVVFRACGGAMEFQTPKGRKLTELCIDSSADGSGRGRRIALRCKFPPGDKNPSLSCSPSLKIVSQKVHRHGIIDFVIEVVLLGVNQRISYVIMQYDTTSFGTSYRADETLRITLGQVSKHANFESDLLAQMLGMSSDADHLLAYYRVLNANNNQELPRDQWDALSDNPLKQNTGPDPKKWNCGGALMTFGAVYAPRHYVSGAQLYYRTPSPSKLSAVHFKKETVAAGARKIRQQLKNGNFVQVFVGHNEDLTVEGGIIKPSSNTHYITLFGASASGNEFIFFDPWPTGSIMTYQSGIMGPVKSVFMGTINFVESEGKIRSPDVVSGRHKYVILTGP
ncbi:hypothetical protein [Bradyrhizobium ivorense]|uniref:hypothetical protein n=1 Tax=Bradyrhizobium ivorense TaxID=2511166 RepID=UPI001115D5AD|nr:hypothetical protein [Bradyrhizobium ivorense]